jgi:hypothetical protein
VIRVRPLPPPLLYPIGRRAAERTARPLQRFGRPPWAVGDTFEVVVDPADRSFAALY